MLKEVNTQRSSPWHETPGAATRGVSGLKWESEMCGGQKHGTRHTTDDSMDVTDLEGLSGLFLFSNFLCPCETGFL